MRRQKLAEYVGQIISTKRQKKKLSQEKVAEMLGTTQDVISKMEQGNFSIKFERLEKLANIFECKVAEFFHVPDKNIDNDVEEIADMLKNLSHADKKLVKGTIAEMVRLLKAKPNDK